MKRLTAAALLILSLFVCARAQEPTPSPEADTGILYLYRVEEANKFESRKTKVFLDGKHLIDMPESEFVGFRLPAGGYELKMSSKQSEMPLKVEAGKTYVFRVSETTRGYFWDRQLYVMPNEQGAYQMRNLKPLQDKNIKALRESVVKERPPVP